MKHLNVEEKIILKKILEKQFGVWYMEVSVTVIGGLFLNAEPNTSVK